MKGIEIGQYIIPLWLVAILLISGIGGVLAYYVWRTLTIPIEVKEPFEILYYPSSLKLFPGETEEFNITMVNHASINYSVVLDFSLDNTTYQDNYVTFSDEIYKVIPGQQNLKAWLMVETYAPPINASLTIDFERIAYGPEIFFEDFNNGVADGWTEHLGTWNVINGEYFVTVGLVENGISTVNELDLTDCAIKVKMRFSDTSVGFKAGIVFRHTDNEHYYNFILSNEYDTVSLGRYAPDRPDYGHTFAEESYLVQPNTDYLLKVVVQDDTFTCFINNQKVLSGTNENYAIGKVGLWARNADVFFENFTITEIP